MSDSYQKNSNLQVDCYVPNHTVGNSWVHCMAKGGMTMLVAVGALFLCACGGEDNKAVKTGVECNMSKDLEDSPALGFEEENSEPELEESNVLVEEEESDLLEEIKAEKKKASKPVKKAKVKKDPNYDAAMEAYNEDNGLEAVRLFKKSGSAQAYYMLGVIYESGCGNVGANPMMARKFFKKAARMGSEDAQGKL